MPCPAACPYRRDQERTARPGAGTSRRAGRHDDPGNRSGGGHRERATGPGRPRCDGSEFQPAGAL